MKMTDVDMKMNQETFFEALSCKLVGYLMAVHTERFKDANDAHDFARKVTEFFMIEQSSFVMTLMEEYGKDENKKNDVGVN